jgi:pro-sigmaK processing inhibitor BofA
MELAAYFLLAVLLLYIMARTFSWPFKMLGKLIVNSFLGIILLVIVNAVGGSFGVALGVNIGTVLISGLCGVPGVAFLLVFKYFL